MSPQQRIPVTVLGATGVVGQRFVKHLVDHPMFQIEHLCASERSVGRRYDEACEWHLDGEPYGGLGHLPVSACDPDVAASHVVFSALDTAPARDIEPAYAHAGSHVFSNASAFRAEPDVPLLIPEVNPDHLEILPTQRQRRGWSGSILTNPNCTTTVLVMALAPLHAAFGVEAVTITSLQAASGAGYPGVPSLDLMGNVVPYIPGEEDKVESETQKLLGVRTDGAVSPAAMTVSATCTRVPVVDGHSEAVSLRLTTQPNPAEVREALARWQPLPQQLKLPTAPATPLRLHTAANRPQVRRDVDADAGMSVHVGRIRDCPLLGIKLFLVGHNTERGAAGGSLLNAELAVAQRAI